MTYKSSHSRLLQPRSAPVAPREVRGVIHELSPFPVIWICARLAISGLAIDLKAASFKQSLCNDVLSARPRQGNVVHL